MVDCEIGAIAISDHATVELHINLNTDQLKKGRWRLNTMLMQDKSFDNEISDTLKMFFEINIGSTDKTATVWEASKAYMRGKIIAPASKIKRAHLEKAKKLDIDIHKLDKELAKHFSVDRYQTICKMKYQLHDIYDKKAEYALFRLKTKFYEGGEKNGKILARQLKTTR